jgi:hypothetical protein
MSQLAQTATWRLVCGMSGHPPEFRTSRYVAERFDDVRASMSGIWGRSGLGGDIPLLRTLVESRCGKVALGRTYLLPPLSSGLSGSAMTPFSRSSKPDKQISRIRLSDKTSRFSCRV